MDEWYETEVRVRYAETDQMGIVHHANYLVWFEVGRSDLCRQKGFSYQEMEEENSLLVVAQAQVRYISPAFYDDLLTIRTKVEQIRSRSIRFIYEVHRGSDDMVLVEGETLHFVTDKQKKIISLPDAYRQKLLDQ
jgi:acyl-CoA thioester hydrolase